jgi:hypothetical protein
MATMQERAHCVGWLFETKSVAQTQRNYGTQFNKQPPNYKAIRDWQRRFIEIGSVHDRKRSDRLGIRNVISAIPADMFHRKWQELEYRLDIIRATKKAHIEIF